ADLEAKVKERTADLLIAKERAEESDKLKTEFIRNMSHEVRTPMNGIVGFVDFLDAPDLTPSKRSSFIEVIKNSSHQLLRVIEDILEISRLGTNQVEVHEMEVSLNRLLSEQFSLFHIQAKEKGLSLQLKTALSEEKSTILCDAVKLTTIVSNLLENALKYTHKGSVEFGYHLGDGPGKETLKIYVKDTGTGINPENHKMIFSRFAQEEKELSKKLGGLGLGLSIVKENVELLGGEVSLQSEKGKGSTFFVSIPYRPVETASVEIAHSDHDSSLENATTNLNRYNILLVEDEEINYIYMKLLLKDYEHHDLTLHAKDGKEAVEICGSNPDIDLVLMDLKMPVMNGFEATSLIKEMRPELPVIAQTAYTTGADRDKALSAGCSAFLSKPVNKEMLFRVLNEHLTVT
ncbi:MAG: ATP-binding protein, partial [Bacteroidota bacterium]